MPHSEVGPGIANREGVFPLPTAAAEATEIGSTAKNRANAHVVFGSIKLFP